MSSRIPEILKRLALTLVSLVIGLVLCEGAVRLRQWLRYGTTSGNIYEFVTDPASGLRMLKPGLRQGGIATDSRGFRNPELDTAPRGNHIRLAFLGGSTTFCGEVSSNAKTWPARVGQELSTLFPGAEFDYVNAGVPGYGLDGCLRMLVHRIAALRPDVVVIYEATNDLSADTRELATRQGIFVGKAEEPSWIARRSVGWYLVEKNIQLWRRQRDAGGGVGRLQFEPTELSAGFRRRLQEIVSVSQGIAPVVAVATFSHKVRRDQGPALQLHNCGSSLYYMPYMTVDALLAGFDEYNRVIREVTAESGALLIEAENEIPGDDAHFFDSVHFTDAGAERMASRVVAGLSAAPAFRELVATRSTAPTAR